MPATRHEPRAYRSSISLARTSRTEVVSIRLRPSTSARSSTSPWRRWNRAMLSFVDTACTPDGPSLAIPLAGTSTSRPPIRAFSPTTGGRSAAPSRQTIRSSIGPSRSPRESNNGLPTTDRCTGMFVTAGSAWRSTPPARESPRPAASCFRVAAPSGCERPPSSGRTSRAVASLAQ